MEMVEDTVDRSTGIGGSDVAAVLGIHPWRSPVDLYLEKTGRAGSSDEESEPAYWGKRLEDVVAVEWVSRTGRPVHRVNRTLRHQDAPVLMAHIDRKIANAPALLECKTAGAFVADKWGPSGTDEVPDYYLTQVLHYLSVTGYEWAAVGALIGGQEFRHYEIGADPALQQQLMDDCLRWWDTHVVGDLPPEPRSPGEARLLYPVHDPDKSLVADSETVELVADLKDAVKKRKAAQESEDAAKAQIQRRMGSAERLLSPEGKLLATWKSSAPSSSVDVKALQVGAPEIAKEYTVKRPGSRRFLVK